MVLTTTANIGLGQAGLYALLGYGVVFFGLILLMTVIVLLGKFFVSAEQKTSAKAEAVSAPVETPAPATAPGAAGQLKLYNVEPKTAAMLMAITADKMGKPINELRFLSIREVTQ